ncbi:MAG TPA: hypothetical protein VE130_14530 [Nitrososphaeraceae archaeon]|jgi:hypothetical protein|nr:hypothetical protein [Nitrososphaeraceae archaeon]
MPSRINKIENVNRILVEIKVRTVPEILRNIIKTESNRNAMLQLVARIKE